MRILIVHNRYQNPGGEEQVVTAERALLIAHGHEAPLWEVDNASIKGLAASIKAAMNVAYSWEGRGLMKEKIAEHTPDLVHVHNFFPLLSPSIYDACIEASVPVVQTLHNYRPFCANAFFLRDGKICKLCVNGSPWQAVRYRCYRHSVLGSMALARMVSFHRKRNTWNEKVDRFITPSEFTKRQYVEGGFPAEKIVAKPNFIDAANPPVASGPRTGGLYVGRISEEKGIPTLIDAWRFPDVPLTIIGDGPERSKLEANAPAGVGFLGLRPLDEVTAAMTSAAFMVMPSVWYENFPRVIVEAYAHALPILASRLGAMAELVEDRVTGLLFDPGNADDLAEKIDWMLNHPDEARAMGVAARRRYEERYTPEANYATLMEVYSGALNG